MIHQVQAFHFRKLEKSKNLVKSKWLWYKNKGILLHHKSGYIQLELDLHHTSQELSLHPFRPHKLGSSRSFQIQKLLLLNSLFQFSKQNHIHLSLSCSNHRIALLVFLNSRLSILHKHEKKTVLFDFCH